MPAVGHTEFMLAAGGAAPSEVRRLLCGGAAKASPIPHALVVKYNLFGS